jgi:antibiotic biosynthesis monooxygenase (ABM) superfamily enzyme
MSIKRIWHGWTTPENADSYQELLHKKIFPGIEAKEIPGYHCVELFRRDLGDEVEFVTVMTFDSLDDVKKFQGKDYEKAYIPEEAQQVLKRWDQVATHFDAIEKRVHRL